nr:MAG TPA: hypothetical protein [Microviridae sp.]
MQRVIFRVMVYLTLNKFCYGYIFKWCTALR